MSKGPLILCLLVELWRLYLTPAASETVVTGFLGQSVTLPCMHASWSQSNSMCWGKGSCPKSKCNNELLHTDGLKVLSRTSTRYELSGTIWRGNVSLTISNANKGDETVYCCRIEVPGWFNDVKKNIRLKLMKVAICKIWNMVELYRFELHDGQSMAERCYNNNHLPCLFEMEPLQTPPTTNRPTTNRPTTNRPTTTSAVTTTIAVLPTTVVTTPDLTTRTALQTQTTTALTVATTCPLTTPDSLPEAATLLTTDLSTEGLTLTAESETFFLSSTSQKSNKVTAEDPALLTAEESKAWVFQSTPMASTGETSSSVTSHLMLGQTASYSLIAASLGFVLCASIVAFLLRGKVMKTNCFQKHTRLDNVGESKSVLDDMQHGREDEDSLFTL